MKPIYSYAPFFRPDKLLVSGCFYIADRVVYDPSIKMIVFYIGDLKTGYVDCLDLEFLHVYDNGETYEIPWKSLTLASGQELTELTFQPEEGY